MRWFGLGWMLLLLFALPVLAASAGIEGEWLSAPGDARIRIAPCGEKLCGTIVWLLEPLDDDGGPVLDLENPDESLRRREVLGLRILSDVDGKPNRKGAWKGGRIYDPNNGKTYRCTISLDGKGNLKLRGFIGISLLGRTEIWTPVKPSAPAA